MKTKYQITDSKGRVHKRTTHRTYTHAVVTDYTSKWAEDPGVSVEWTGRLDLARKLAASKAKNPDFSVEIVPVPQP